MSRYNHDERWDRIPMQRTYESSGGLNRFAIDSNDRRFRINHGTITRPKSATNLNGQVISYRKTTALIWGQSRVCTRAGNTGDSERESIT